MSKVCFIDLEKWFPNRRLHRHDESRAEIAGYSFFSSAWSAKPQKVTDKSVQWREIGPYSFTRV